MNKKRLYVGGIILNDSGEILLVKRSHEERFMQGMWSLPAGEVEKGEGFQKALVREIKEETNLVVKVQARVAHFERATWSVSVYECSFVEGEIQNNDSDVDEVRYVPLNELPEITVLEALMAIFLYQAQRGALSAPYFYYIESLFSAIFYSYIAPEMAILSDINGYELIKHSILNTPFRKFKSALIFLLCNSHHKARSYAVLAEASFAVFTILDDVCDGRKTRYEKNTVSSKYGLDRTVTLLFTIVISLKEAILNLPEMSHYANKIVTALWKLGIAEEKKFSNLDFDSIDDYLENSYERSRFLEVIWTATLSELGYQDEQRLIQAVYPHVAMLGQIVNDYYDMIHTTYQSLDVPPIFTDVWLTRINYYVLLLLKKTKKRDREVFINTIWGKKSETNSKRLEAMLKKYKIKELIETDVQKRASRISEIIHTSQIEPSKKLLLRNWVDVQFTKLIDTNSEKEKTHRLASVIDAINTITYNVR